MKCTTPQYFIGIYTVSIPTTVLKVFYISNINIWEYKIYFQVPLRYDTTGWNRGKGRLRYKTEKSLPMLQSSSSSSSLLFLSHKGEIYASWREYHITLRTKKKHDTQKRWKLKNVCAERGQDRTGLCWNFPPKLGIIKKKKRTSCRHVMTWLAHRNEQSMSECVMFECVNIRYSSS